MLIVAPTGNTNRVTLLSMPRFSSRQRKVTGNVPALKKKEAYQDFRFTLAIIQLLKMPNETIAFPLFTSMSKILKGKNKAQLEEKVI